MKALELLRQYCKGEEFDYSLLMSCLKDYTKPRDKVTSYLKNKDIIRVKKGLYIFGERFRHNFVSLEVLANLIYGPSYISLEYALAFYGMIPERVEWVTSMTMQKNKKFQTPIGSFSYTYLHSAKYSVGVTQFILDPARHFLIASKEKALVDLLGQQESFKTKEELLNYLLHGLRLEEKALWKLNRKTLQRITAIYQHPSAHLLYQLIKERS